MLILNDVRWVFFDIGETYYKRSYAVIKLYGSFVFDFNLSQLVKHLSDFQAIYGCCSQTIRA